MDKKITLRNRPVIDPETGKEEWISRSLCVAVFVYARDMFGNEYILANKRGKGCPNYVGYWNVPCGYLDYGERLRDAAIREVFEETGVRVPYNRLSLYHIQDDKFGDGKENVTIMYVARCDELFEALLNISNSEKNEVSDLMWIPVEKVEDFKWAFGHLELIKETR